MMKMSMNLMGFLSAADAPDGYLVEIEGKIGYRDELESLWMVLNDYDGYEIISLTQTTGRKKRLSFFLRDKA